MICPRCGKEIDPIIDTNMVDHGELYVGVYLACPECDDKVVLYGFLPLSDMIEVEEEE